MDRKVEGGNKGMERERERVEGGVELIRKLN